ncbi:nicotinate-nucleotide adenylyltransferase [soil metagenome]
MKAGLFGGTFDPPHVGHLIVAQDALIALQLDRIVFVPAATPPHKQDRHVTPPQHRLRMLELAIGDNSAFAVDRMELDRPGPSYTVDTLRELSDREPSADWTLLIGADQYAEFDTWKEPGEVRRMARIGVMGRAGTELPSDPAGTVTHVDVTRIDISSTAIRQRVANGLSIRYHVPAQVEAFIFENRLYGRNGTSVAG